MEVSRPTHISVAYSPNRESQVCSEEGDWLGSDTYRTL